MKNRCMFWGCLVVLVGVMCFGGEVLGNEKPAGAKNYGLAWREMNCWMISALQGIFASDVLQEVLNKKKISAQTYSVDQVKQLDIDTNREKNQKKLKGIALDYFIRIGKNIRMARSDWDSFVGPFYYAFMYLYFPTEIGKYHDTYRMLTHLNGFLSDDIKDVFRFTTKRIKKLSKCSNPNCTQGPSTTTQSDIEMTLLSEDGEDGDNVKELIKTGLNAEVVTEPGKLCTECGQGGRTVEKDTFYFDHLPKVFTFVVTQSEKKSMTLLFSDTINLGEFLEKPNQTTYKLIALSTPYCTGGHYMAYVLGNDKNWYFYDCLGDELVKVVGNLDQMKQDMKNKNVYPRVFFYEKIEAGAKHEEKQHEKFLENIQEVVNEIVIMLKQVPVGRKQELKPNLLKALEKIQEDSKKFKETWGDTYEKELDYVLNQLPPLKKNLQSHFSEKELEVFFNKYYRSRNFCHGINI
ncbi:MAG: ubiquitin carboxyl-terminal hydrolase family protein [bacterium]